MDDFSEYPKSVAEIKSSAEENGALWKPRDVLIDTLRAIDSGKINPDALVVIHSSISDTKDGVTNTAWAQAGPNVIYTLGMLQYALGRLTR